jgi:23S rRNA (cytosine1962-C5)-methyltransferase
VQLSHEGAPIAGDAEYGGEPAARLLLHAAELTVGTARFEVPVPPGFERFVRGEAPALGDPAHVRRALTDAGILRAPLAAVSDAYRLTNDLADDLPGVTIDRYGDHAVLHASTEEAEARAPELAAALVELGARGVYLKVRRRADARRASKSLAPETPILGEPAAARFLVTERGLRLWVELGRGQSTGLFLDQRENRRRVRELAGGRRVLNLFSYTSSFGAAAAAGGASEVVSVDLAAPALATARDNFLENGIDPAAHRFLKDDALDFLARAARRGERYDLVVLDPPSFASSAAGSPFAVAKHYGRAAELSLAVLAAGGRLLAVTNHRKTTSGRLRRLLRDAAERANVSVVQLKDLPAQLDCPDGPDGPVPSKSVLLTRR